MRPRSAVLFFALRVLAWLVPCFAAWYWLAPWFDRPAAWLSQGLLGVFRGGLVDVVEFEGRLLNFVTTLEMPQEGGRVGVLVVEVNPLLSTYGAPLFAALLFASRGNWRKFLLGLAVLLPFQAWGIAFDFIAQVLRSGPEVVARAGLLGWRAEFAALAYQAGSLIFPALVPLAAWAAMQRQYIRVLVSPSSAE